MLIRNSDDLNNDEGLAGFNLASGGNKRTATSHRYLVKLRTLLGCQCPLDLVASVQQATSFMLTSKIPIYEMTSQDIFTREDAEFLTRNDALPPERIRAVETGGCPHAAIREDVSGNIAALEELCRMVKPTPQLLLCESGGDNLAANFSRELSDFTIYVIDVAGGDKVPRKGGPGITQSDLLIVNKTDLAPAVGADLGVMKSDAARMRGDGPTVFASVRNDDGVAEIQRQILAALESSGSI